MRRLEPVEDRTVNPLFVRGDKLRDANNYEADGRRYESPISVIVVPGIARAMPDLCT